MATLSELQTRLTNIQTAIDAVLNGGQDYKVADGLIDTWVRRADIDALYREQLRLEKRISIKSRSGGGVIGI